MPRPDHKREPMRPRQHAATRAEIRKGSNRANSQATRNPHVPDASSVRPVDDRRHGNRA